MKCICGCGLEAPLAKITRKERGWVKGKPMRFAVRHHWRKPGPLYQVNQNGCWIWLRYIMKNGYGAFCREGINLAHRYFYIKKYGKIPKGKELDHLCRNRACVNPDHLEPVTRTENSHRGAKAKVNYEIAQEIRKLKGIKTQKEISKIFKIGRTLVYGILEDQVWIRPVAEKPYKIEV